MEHDEATQVVTPWMPPAAEALKVDVPEDKDQEDQGQDGEGRSIPIGTADDSLIDQSEVTDAIDPDAMIAAFKADVAAAQGAKQARHAKHAQALVGNKLDKEDVRSLVGATQVTFSLEHDATLIKVDRVKNDPTYGLVNFGREITAKSAPVKTYGAETPSSCALKVSGTDKLWETISNALREGDVIELEWHSDTQDWDLQGAGFVRDALFLNITRYDGRGRGAIRNFSYFVGDRIVKADSDERICSFPS